MGIINAGTAVGAVVAPPLIALAPVLTRRRLIRSRSVAMGVLHHGCIGTRVDAVVVASTIGRRGTPSGAHARGDDSLATLLRFRETWTVVIAKFLSDAAWYFYLFWLPKFLFDTFKLDIKTAGSIGWIPYAASGVGCLCGGALSSWLLGRGVSVNMSRKVALGASAALMPWVMLVPQLHSVGWVIFIFSVAFFGQQSWSTLVMILPTDLIDRRAVGTLAGLVGFGGAMGGVLLGQIVDTCAITVIATPRRFHLRLAASSPSPSSASAFRESKPRLGRQHTSMKITEIRTRVVQWKGKTTPLPPHFCTNPWTSSPVAFAGDDGDVHVSRLADLKCSQTTTPGRHRKRGAVAADRSRSSSCIWLRCSSERTHGTSSSSGSTCTARRWRSAEKESAWSRSARSTSRCGI
jgi:hypothetical protein